MTYKFSVQSADGGRFLKKMSKLHLKIILQILSCVQFFYFISVAIFLALPTYQLGLVGEANYMKALLRSSDQQWELLFPCTFLHQLLVSLLAISFAILGCGFAVVGVFGLLKAKASRCRRPMPADIVQDPRGNSLKRGTQVSLQMKPEAMNYLEENTLRELARKFGVFGPLLVLVVGSCRADLKYGEDDEGGEGVTSKVETDLGAEREGSRTDDGVVKREEEAIKIDGLNVAQIKELRDKAEKFQFQAEVSRMMKLMSKEELVKNLGTIAKSGTSDFLAKMQDSSSTQELSDLLGQFGVCFYSSFLVADRVIVWSKSTDDEQHIWESDAAQFSVVQDPRGNSLQRGTQVSLQIKPEAMNYLEENTLRELVRKYSQFINFPIYLWMEKTVEKPLEEDEVPEKKEDDIEDADAQVEEAKDEEMPKTKKVSKTVYDWELVNDAKPIWTCKPGDVENKEYDEFYKSITKDSQKPIGKTHFIAEGEVTFKALLARKALGMLKKLEGEDYDEFCKEYSTNIKLGVIEDTANKSRLAKLLRFQSSNGSGLTSLANYVSRMKDKQESIFDIAGASRDEVEKSPFVERLLKKGYEVLYRTETVDEYTIGALPEFEGKKFQNVAKEGLSLAEGTKAQRKLEETKKIFELLTKWLTENALKEQILKAELSERLDKSPCALVTSRFGYTGNMERIIASQTHSKANDVNREYYLNQKKTLEINPRHPLIMELLRRVNDDGADETAKEIALMMFRTATLRSGYMLKDTVDFAQNVESMMRQTLGIPADKEVEEDDSDAGEEDAVAEDADEDASDDSNAEDDDAQSVGGDSVDTDHDEL